MKLRILQYFLAVAREQSIVRAEEILNLVHKTEREISLSDEVVVAASDLTCPYQKERRQSKNRYFGSEYIEPP